MIAHVVMFRPPPHFMPSDREVLLDAMRHAFLTIAGITRVRIGRRKLMGRAYEALMTDHMEWFAILEFGNEGDLRTYLEHPAHADLGRQFFESAEAALVYDFVIVEPDRVRDLLDDRDL